MKSSPIKYRKGIPFYHDKTSVEFQRDKYESYEIVQRQSMVHLSDYWETYPFQDIIDLGNQVIMEQTHNVLEIGCGLGNWIGRVAQKYPEIQCVGIDYSYQLLKRADEFWISNKSIELDGTERGYSKATLNGYSINNLLLALAKAENLPIDDSSQDIVLSSFLIDRLTDPILGLKEMHRVLKLNGKMVVVTPLNFNHSEHWQRLYPVDKFIEEIKTIGFVINYQSEIIVKEPLDKHGNAIHWKCISLIATKI